MASDKVRCPVCGWVGRPTPSGKVRKHAGVGDRPSCSGSGQQITERDHEPTTAGWDPGAA